MNRRVKKWCAAALGLHKGFIGPENRVLEVGSFDVNGSVRDLFQATDYTGIDIRPGDRVDIVCHGADFDAAPFDVVVSTETLEHDSRWKETLANMHRLLKPGGLFLFTVATASMPPHNVKECGGHYRNLSLNDLASVIDFSAEYRHCRFDIVPRRKTALSTSLRLWAVKAAAK